VLDLARRDHRLCAHGLRAQAGAPDSCVRTTT